MTDDKNVALSPLKVVRPFCPQCMEIFLTIATTNASGDGPGQHHQA